MGHGDDIMATGFARGARARGKRIAFGDGSRIIWGPFSKMIFKGNPNIAAPGQEGAADIEWHPFCKGNRLYNKPNPTGWEWNYNFRPVPGEIVFDDAEKEFAGAIKGSGYLLIEPNAPDKGRLLPNKQWSPQRWQQVAERLIAAGFELVQCQWPGTRQRLRGARMVATPTFRHALAALSKASMFIGHEGGMHHGAAALSKRAVVIFGGFIPPEVTGYPNHANLAAGGRACGWVTPCPHCRAALDSITVEQVIEAVEGQSNVDSHNVVMGHQVQPEGRPEAGVRSAEESPSGAQVHLHQ